MYELKKADKKENFLDIADINAIESAFKMTSCNLIISNTENLMKLSDIIKHRTDFTLGLAFGALFSQINEWKDKIDMQNRTADLESRLYLVESEFKKEIKELNGEIERLKKQRLSVSLDSVSQLWDNEYDEQWNSL